MVAKYIRLPFIGLLYVTNRFHYVCMQPAVGNCGCILLAGSGFPLDVDYMSKVEQLAGRMADGCDGKIKRVEREYPT